jgi:hypothetical protein
VRIIDQTTVTITAVRKRLARRDDQTEAAITEPRKRLGDRIDAPSAKRQKNVQTTEPVIGYTKAVLVRLYQHRLDWDHIREARVSCNNDGGLDLEKVGEQLGVQGKCRVS